MSDCKLEEFSYSTFIKELLIFIKDKKIKAQLIKLDKENRITYVEHCGYLEWFDINGEKKEIQPLYTNNGTHRYIRPRREHEHNVLIQYIPDKLTIEGRKYITLKIDE